MTEPIVHPYPFRLRVMRALNECLESIERRDLTDEEKANPNFTERTFARRVFRGRDGFGDNDPVPMISILEPPLPIDQLPSPVSSTGSTGDWDLLIQGFVLDDHENPTDPAHVLMADVKRALAVEKKRLIPNSGGTPDPFGMGRPQIVNGKAVGNCVKEIVIGPGVVRPPGDGVSNKAYFWLTLTMKIVEDMHEPFL